MEDPDAENSANTATVQIIEELKAGTERLTVRKESKETIQNNSKEQGLERTKRQSEIQSDAEQARKKRHRCNYSRLDRPTQKQTIQDGAV